jgi:magnesium-transporting ATPase (P-type)
MQLTAYASDVDVRRDGVWTKVDFRLLVPGDLVRVRSSWSLPCDLLIIQGAHSHMHPYNSRLSSVCRKSMDIVCEFMLSVF